MSDPEKSKRVQTSSLRTLAKIQAASGATFGSFLALHLITHASIHSGSVSVPNNLMHLFRAYYQNPVVEVAIISVAGAVHLAAALANVAVRNQGIWKGETKNKLPDEKTNAGGLLNSLPLVGSLAAERNWHKITGWLLALIVPAHYYGARIIPSAYYRAHSLPISSSANPTAGIDETFFVNVINEAPPVVQTFLIILVSSAVYHWGVGAYRGSRALTNKYQNQSPPALRIGIAAIGLVMVSTTFALAGWYFPIEVPRKAEFDAMSL
jgi:hypothetical protein